MIRFAVVGVVSNGVLYALYLLMRYIGVEHNLAMTVAFLIGVSQTFLANRAWSFRSRLKAAPAFGRYLMVYLMAYLINLMASVIFVDRLGYPDRAVQAIMVVVIAMLLFGAQKFWVFRQSDRQGAVVRGRM